MQTKGSLDRPARKKRLVADKVGSSALPFETGIAEKIDRKWSISVSKAPSMPTISFSPAVQQRQVSSVLSALSIFHQDDVAAGKIAKRIPGLSSNKHDVVDYFDTESDEEIQLISKALAFSRISHHAFFRISGIWMVQSIVFAKDYRVGGVICWPCGVRITSARAVALALGQPVPGIQAKLDVIYAGGGYVALNMPILGIKGFPYVSLSAGIVPQLHLNPEKSLMVHDEKSQQSIKQIH